MAQLSLAYKIKSMLLPWRKALAYSVGGIIACSSVMVSTNSVAEEMSEEKAAIAAANARYMREIVPVYFPAVPFGWKVMIANNIVSYISTATSETTSKGTRINMRYTRNTSNMDAATYMDYYVSSHACEPKIKQGTSFYTTACITNNTYTIVIGEKDNMYVIELVGDYNAAARAIIENYVGAIVGGKKVFYDRHIGDLSTRDPMLNSYEDNY